MENGRTIRIYSGTEVTTLLLKEELEQAGIGAWIRNDFQSGVVAGFAASVSSEVDLFIDENDVPAAEPIINQFLTINEQQA